jgi:hypothetical protein
MEKILILEVFIIAYPFIIEDPFVYSLSGL